MPINKKHKYSTVALILLLVFAVFVIVSGIDLYDSGSPCDEGQIIEVDGSIWQCGNKIGEITDEYINIILSKYNHMIIINSTHIMIGNLTHGVYVDMKGCIGAGNLTDRSLICP